MKKLISISILVILLSGCGAPNATKEFAQCLTDNGAIFYGSDTCGHCLDQKEMFGTAISSVNYVNCQFNIEACTSANIMYYPTWKVDGEPLGDSGVKSFDVLAEATGCELETLES